jgi:hypothetical protein
MRERLKVRRLVRVCVGLAAVLAASATTADAAIVQTFSTAQSPFPGGAIPLNQGVISFNYFYGISFPPQRGPYPVFSEARGSADRNWFTFDLRSSCTATDATLQLVRGSEVGPGDLGGADYTIHEVTTPAEDIYTTPFPPDPYAFFFDLGDGPIFGGGAYPLDGAPSDVLTYRLNAAGVAAFNAARGDFFTLGGTGGGRTYYETGGTPPQRNSIFAEVSDPAKLIVMCALPANKAQCKNGGWRDYPPFKNQGDCVSFVATKGKNQPGGL